jgi:flavin-dependent dehydrogenase
MTQFDVVVVGAGPAGAVAATLLARAGARVRVLDRATFPRDKLCGDTLNPGALSALGRLDLAGDLEANSLRVDGMRVTGPYGVVVDSRYPDGLRGCAILRRDLDWTLLQGALRAGARFEPATLVRRAIVDDSRGGPLVTGVVVGVNGHQSVLQAPVVIAADGRRSTLAFALGLARHPPAPRRWAIGAYVAGVQGLSSLGEMHIRKGRYIGVAAVPGGIANVCLVRPSQPADEALRDPARLLTNALSDDPWLRDRFAGARFLQPPVVLGPLAVDQVPGHVDGLLLAGDAAGFIDPMTGDGVRFAIRGGALAAQAALEALSDGWRGVHARLAEARRAEFLAKWRFNRLLRACVASSSAMDAGALAVRVWPGVLRRVINEAGDCRMAALQ